MNFLAFGILYKGIDLEISCTEAESIPPLSFLLHDSSRTANAAAASVLTNSKVWNRHETWNYLLQFGL